MRTNTKATKVKSALAPVSPLAVGTAVLIRGLLTLVMLLLVTAAIVVAGCEP